MLALGKVGQQIAEVEVGVEVVWVEVEPLVGEVALAVVVAVEALCSKSRVEVGNLKIGCWYFEVVGTQLVL